ncbi:hypothetical protein BGZ82_003870 [Podila clonocystis]|nr:hypothetical protein BGZ82_003870 [Podila clonocystis]
MNQLQHEYLFDTIGDSISLEEWAQLGDVNLAIEMDAQWRYDALRTLARSDVVHHQQAYTRLCKIDASTRMAIFKDVEAWKICLGEDLGRKRRWETTPPEPTKRTKSNTLISCTESTSSSPSINASISAAFAEMLDKFQDAVSRPARPWVVNGTLDLDERVTSVALNKRNEIFLHSFILDVGCEGTMALFTEMEQEAIRSAKSRPPSSCKPSIVEYMLTFNKETLDDLWTRLETNDARNTNATKEDLPVRDWIYNSVYQFARLVEGKTNNGFGWGLSKKWYTFNLWKFLIDDFFLNSPDVRSCHKVSAARAYRKYTLNHTEEQTSGEGRIDGVFVTGSHAKEVGAVCYGLELGKEEGDESEIMAEELRLGKLLKDQHDYFTRFTAASKGDLVVHGIQANGPCIQFQTLDHVAGRFMRLQRSPLFTVPDKIDSIMDLLEIMSQLVVMFTEMKDSIKLLARPRPENPVEWLTKRLHTPSPPALECPPTANSPNPLLRKWHLCPSTRNLL